MKNVLQQGASEGSSSGRQSMALAAGSATAADHRPHDLGRLRSALLPATSATSRRRASTSSSRWSTTSTLAMAAQAGRQARRHGRDHRRDPEYRSEADCFKAVAVLDESHGGDGIVATDKVNSIADLKGQTVAMNEGSTSQFWFSYLLKKNGVALCRRHRLQHERLMTPQRPLSPAASPSR